MVRLTLTLLLFVAGLCMASPSVGVAQVLLDVFLEDFDDGVLDGNLVVSTTDGFSLLLTDGKALLEKEAGTTNGHAYLYTAFLLDGDFTASITADRVVLDGRGEMGLAFDILSGGFVDIFFHEMDEIFANIMVPGIYDIEFIALSASPMALRISRIDSTVFLEYDDGSGFQTLASAAHPSLSTSGSVRAFLLQEYGYEEHHEGTLDDLRIQADLASVDDAPHPVGPVRVIAAPNPANGANVFRCAGFQGPEVTLKLFDTSGRLLQSLVPVYNGSRLVDITWDGTDAKGRRVSPGVYFAVVSDGRVTESTRFVVMR